MQGLNLHDDFHWAGDIGGRIGSNAMIESSVMNSRASGCGAVDVEIVNQSDNCFGADMLQRKCATKS